LLKTLSFNNVDIVLTKGASLRKINILEAVISEECIFSEKCNEFMELLLEKANEGNSNDLVKGPKNINDVNMITLKPDSLVDLDDSRSK